MNRQPRFPPLAPVRAAQRFLALALVLVSSIAGAAQFPNIPAPPDLGVKAYILIDYDTGETLAELEPDMRLEPASLTKIMTVYAVAEALRRNLIKLDDKTIVSEYAWKQEGSRMFIDVDKPVTVDELLHGDIIQSGNDASVALAEHVSGTEETFATVMNQHAETLGMKDSRFTNSTGLPHPDHYTTARDMAVLSRALIHDFPDIYALFKIPEYTYNGITQKNRNGLLGKDPSVDGVKTGHTELAGYCLIASAQRDGMRLVSVVMGADSDGARTRASQALLNYGFRFYETRKLYGKGAKVATARVWQGEHEHADLGVTKDVFVTFPRGRYDELDAKAEIATQITAPVAEGQQLGTVKVVLGDTSITTIALSALAEVPEGSLAGQLIDRVMMMFE
ncbi:MAG: D-alanyl-D-alanine carboxypeptidase [Gammaproteobacteria bacterium]|nr:D-alanyl-D-alanine carboxypeptidase [Gammaproteobacteria bacterium]